MTTDAHRTLLGLPQLGRLSQEAIRAAYWRRIRDCGGPTSLALLQEAKRVLLYGAGVRIPGRARKD
jgi:hypothetical protein